MGDSVPTAPVLRKDAVCDKNGILISWISPSNCKIDSFTVSWKAASWWQSAQAILPAQLKEFLISDIPPNEKVSVWVYSSNEYASSSWSEAVDFVSSRDCGNTTVEPDIVREVPVNAKVLYDVMYTKEFDEYVIEAGLVNNVEHLKYDEKEGQLNKIVRVTPPIPPSLLAMSQTTLGSQAFTYEEHSTKYLDRFEIDFEIKNMPIVGQYVETSKGKLRLVAIDDTKCRLEGFFDLRINYPVIGFYVAQVIRSQVVSELTEWPIVGVKFLTEKKGMKIGN
jgi:hypothetical protein